MGVILESVGRAVAKHRLVEDLQEVDPDKDGQDDLVRLAADAATVLISQFDLPVANERQSPVRMPQLVLRHGTLGAGHRRCCAGAPREQSSTWGLVVVAWC
ncbi:hypothetical protein J3459_012056 [Metarhizium acridum]|nr:hypothetical protein J3459_012056 [Metarhizium acridum]